MVTLGRCLCLVLRCGWLVLARQPPSELDRRILARGGNLRHHGSYNTRPCGIEMPVISVRPKSYINKPMSRLGRTAMKVQRSVA